MIRTKIIATVGPACDSPERICELIDAGVDVFRLNFSHGTLDEHGKSLAHIRAASQQCGSTVAVMGDLCGPKIRIDTVENGAFEIRPGDSLEILDKPVVGNPRHISTSRPQIISELAVGNRVLIDDGLVRLRVSEAFGDRLRCVCESGGVIATRKGINLPDSSLEMPALTDKDRQDLEWALRNGLDYVALSFVRTAGDLRELRDLMPLSNETYGVVAKIETARAVDNLDEIIETADVVLVARGDLGVEMDLAHVPLVQKEITRKCRQAGRPVIIATQMLQSMVESATATRAEVSDVANAVLDTADCVMLSAETSVGAHPVESVRMMNRIIEETEAYSAACDERVRMDPVATLRQVTTAVAHGASLLATELDAKLVAVWTETGNTARLLSKCRLRNLIIGMSPDERVCRRMALYYGVLPIRLPRNKQVQPMLREVDRMLLSRNLAMEGDLIVVIDGTRLTEPGATNALLIHLLKS